MKINKCNNILFKKYLLIFITIIFVTKTSFAFKVIPSIYFKENSIDTVNCRIDESNKGTLKIIATTLMDNPGLVIKIRAYALENEINPKILSLKRAEWVKQNLFLSHGINTTKIECEGIVISDNCNDSYYYKNNEKQCLCESRNASFTILSRKDKPKTNLTIVQGINSFKIEDTTNSIILESKPFKLVFQTENCKAVFLNASFDSTSFLIAQAQMFNELTCFTSSQTYSEYSKNNSHDIIVEKNTNDGYHCLFAHSVDEEFIRFDSTLITDNDHWTGIRSVDNLSLDKYIEDKWEYMKGKTIYLCFSPEIVHYAKCLMVTFKE